MEVRRADFFGIAGFCLLLILAVSIAGCTAQNTGTTIPVAPSTPVDPTAGATTPAQPSPTPAPILTTLAAPPTQTSVPITQSPDPVSLTINSAGKQTKVYTMVPKPGRTFLVLNITIQNNAVAKGFYLSDSSLSLSYGKSGHSPEPSITGQVRGGLENPIIMPTKIEQNDKRTGQVVFGVADGSGRYTVNLIGSDGAVVASSATIDLR